MKTASYLPFLTQDSPVRAVPAPLRPFGRKRGLCADPAASPRRIGLPLLLRPSFHIVPSKKTLYHFYPDRIFSAPRLHVKCIFCQNCEISEKIVPTTESPVDSFGQAIIESTPSASLNLFDLYRFRNHMEIGAMSRNTAEKNVMVTNGYMEPPVSNSSPSSTP